MGKQTKKHRGGAMKRTGTLSLILLILIGAFSTVLAQGTLDLLGRWPYGPANAVDYNASVVCMSNGSVLEIHSVGDGTTNPYLTKVSEITLPDVITDIHITGSAALGYNAFVTCGKAGMQIVQIGASPTIVGSFNTSGNALGIFQVGDYAYIADGDNGLLTLDVSDKANPDSVSNLKFHDTLLDVQVITNTAYLAGGAYGLFAADVTTAATPAKYDSLETTGYVSAVHFEGTTAYLADGAVGLTRADLTTLTNITQIDIWNPGVTVNFTDVFVLGGNAYITDALHGLRVVDVSLVPPAGNPTPVGDLATAGSSLALSMDVNNEDLFIADGGNGMRMIDVTVPGTPVELASVLTADVANDVLSAKGATFVAGGTSGLWVINHEATEATTTPVLAHISTLTNTQGLAMMHDTLFVADADLGLYIYDMANPASPALITSTVITGGALGVDLDFANEQAVVASGGQGLHTVDISTLPSAGTIGAPSRIDLGTSNVTHVKVEGLERDLAYASAGANGVYVVNVSTGAQVNTIPTFDFPHATDFYQPDSILIVADDASGLRFYDLVDPAAPVLLSTYDTPGTSRDVLATENYGFIADGQGTVRMVDFTENTPAETDSFHTVGLSQGLSLMSDTLAVADGLGGVYFLKADLGGVLVALQDSLKYGEVPVTIDSFRTLQLTNTGFSDIVVDNISSPTENLTATPNALTVSPGDTETVSIAFNVTFAGEYTDTLNVYYNNWDDTLFVYSTANAVDLIGTLEVERDTVQFGNVIVGNERSTWLQIDNTGIGTVTLASLGLDAGPFTVNNFPDFINAGQSEYLNIKFEPQENGTVIRELEIRSDATNDTISVILKGRGINYTPLTAYEPDYYTYSLLHMDVLDGDTINDASRYGLMDGVRSGATLTTDDDGKFDEAMNYDQVTDSMWVELDSLEFLPEWQGFSMDLWFRMSTLPTDPTTLMILTDSLSIPYKLYVDEAGNGTVVLRGETVNEVGVNTYETRTLTSDSISTLITGKWYHAALTYGERLTLYLDGILQDSVTVDIGGGSDDTQIRIGNNVGGTETFAGSIDEVRISGIEREPWEFNVSTGRAQLSTDDINFGNVLLGSERLRWLYVTNTGSGVLYIDSSRTVTSEFRTSDDSYALEPGFTQKIPVIYRPSAAGFQDDNLTLYTQDITRPMIQVPLEGTGYTTVSTTSYSSDAYTSGLWHLDGTPGVDSTITDGSSSGMTGYFRERSGIDWSTSVYRYGNSSLYYNGGYVWVPRTTAPAGNVEPFTVETWFNMDSRPASGLSYTLFRQGMADSTSFEIIIQDTTKGLVANFYTANGDSIPLRIPSRFIETETWYHLGYAWDLDTLRFYLNGDVVADTAFSGDPRTPTAGYSFGSDYGLGSNFKGYMDEIRFSNIARAASEFTQVLPDLSTITEINFGEVVTNTTALDSFEISNIGYQDLSVQLGDPTLDQYVLTTQNYTIAPQVTVIDSITFSPTTVGLHKDSILVVSNDPVQDSSYIQIRGTGIIGPRLVAADTLEFMTTQVGQTNTKMLIIENTGDKTLEVDTLMIASTSVFSVPDTTLEILSSESASILVTFAPLLEQVYWDSVKIGSNDPHNPEIKVALTGSGKSYRYKKPYTTDESTLALYHFEELADSAVAADSSGNEHHGTLKNGVSWLDNTQGYFGQAVHFDGVNDHITVPTHGDLVFNLETESFTVECFFKTDTVNQTLFSKDFYGSTRHPNYYLNIDKDGYLKLFTDVVDEQRVSDGAWHHVAYIYNHVSGMIYLYLDGELRLTHEVQTNDLDATADGPFVIGARQFNSNTYVEYFEGDIDELRISSIARSPVDFAFDPNPEQVISIALSPTQPRIGRAETVSISVNTKYDPTKAYFYYKEGGAAKYNTVRLDTMRNAQDNVYTVTIPKDSITFNGLEYYVDVETDSGNYSRPLYSPKYNPLTKQVRFLTKKSEVALKGKEYRMVSFPADMDKPHIDDVLIDDLGPYNPYSWRCFTWQYFGYAEFSDTLSYEDSLYFNAEPGRAFWIITNENKTFDVDTGYTVSTDASFDFNLQPHWNMIGSPFPFRVAWDDCILFSDSISTLFHRYSKGYRTDWSHFNPWDGYWIYNYDTEYQKLSVPPRATGVKKDAMPKRAVLAEMKKEDWVVRLSLIHEIAEDLDNFMGAREGANDEWDMRDRPEPPPMGDYISLYMNRDNWKTYPGQYSADIRQPGQEGYTYNFTVQSNLNKQSLQFVWEFIQNMPETWQAYLVDLEEGVSANLLEQEGYAIKTSSSDETSLDFQLICGTEAYCQNASDIPLKPIEFELHQNYPNPFNPTTHIKYAIPKNGHVKITVFNMMGQQVQVLVDEEQKTGIHEIVWDSNTNRHARAASGIYFCRLEFPGKVAVRKMVLVK